MSSDVTATPTLRFRDLALIEPLQQALDAVGYESPSPIQAATIPELLTGRDVLGQAQTGTGKTAAFALPALSRLNLDLAQPQVLVLAPTRELAIQVAEAFQRYASHLKGFHVLPIYGGQSYEPQLKSLRRGVHVVVGTPGRVVDHIKRGTLKLDSLQMLVLDEADEMLRMGFIDDVEWVLQQTPATRQIALFSATMPSEIRRVAQTHLKNPAEITIKSRTTTAANIRQRYWLVSGMHKLDALTRLLEVETFDGMIVFARTKIATNELAEKLEARGFAAAALNGDIAQQQRERTIAKLKGGQLDILVATDVAARGLDVERISHVINYDIPTDTEAYVHRIGRTGRAGRAGEAILFVAPRERGLLRNIERATRQPVEPMSLPGIDAVNNRRIAKFKQTLTDTLADPQAAAELHLFKSLLEDYERECNVSALDIAAALARKLQGNAPLLLSKPTPGSDVPERPARDSARDRFSDRPEKSRARREDHDAPREGDAPLRKSRPRGNDEGLETYRVEVGHNHGVKPGNLVGAIANEAGLESEYIGRIDIRDDYSLIDLPGGMPEDVFQHLQKTRVAGQPLRISRGGDSPGPRKSARPSPDRPKRDFKSGKSGHAPVKRKRY